MTEDAPHRCQLYLIVPAGSLDADRLDDLAHMAQTGAVAAMRLATDGQSEDAIRKDAGRLRKICHGADIPLILSEHYRLVSELGLDGVHLLGTRDIRAARAELGAKASIGAFVGTSRHAGMTAGEAGADYVSFGPVTASNLGSGDVMARDEFAWWHQMIEIPSVAEGWITPDAAISLAPFADFLALGPEIWSGATPPLKVLVDYAEAIEPK